jgi:hypothetical protein
MVEPFWKPINSMDADAFREHIDKHPFLKIGKKFPLEKDDLGEDLIESYKMLNFLLNTPPQHFP